jgi:hypothetical protein
MPIIEAKYPSVCLGCEGPIFPGDPIVPTMAPSKSGGRSASPCRWRHAGCRSAYDRDHDATTGTGMYEATDGRRPDGPPAGFEARFLRGP